MKYLRYLRGSCGPIWMQAYYNRWEGGKAAVPTRAHIRRLKVRRDSQGSLSKTEASTYLDDNAAEL